MAKSDSQIEMSKKRKKEDDPSSEKDDVSSSLTVKLKLVSAVKEKMITPVLQELVDRLNPLILDGYLLANFHFLRCFEEGLEIPLVCHTFFYRCMSLSAEKDQDLKESISQFNELRPIQDEERDTKYMGLLMSAVSQEMLTASVNHLVLNFEGRLRRFVRMKYGLEKRDVTSFVVGAFKGGDGVTDDQKEFKEWIGDVYPFNLEVSTFKGNVKLQVLLAKLRDMLMFQEGLDPETKGRRTFTLFPTKGGFVQSHIPICRSHLGQVLKHLTSEGDQVSLVCSLLDRAIHLGPDGDEFPLLNEAYNQGRLTWEILTNKWCIEQLWDILFDFKRHETRTRKFAYRVTTNGYEVCLLFDRMAVKKPKTKSKKVKETPFDHFVGIDPGKTFIMNSFDGSKSNKMSTGEYCFLGKNRQQMKWNENLKKSNDMYRETIQNLPSLKTANLETFKTSARVHLEKSPFLFRFCKDKAFRKWRFKTYRFQRKALSQVCKETVNDLEGKVCVGIGDWSQPQGFKGLPTAPVQRLQKEFKNHCEKVTLVREFNTSKVCSVCEQSIVKSVKFRTLKLSPSHQVVRCCANECAKCWQRDINASRNIYKLLRLQETGHERPEIFSKQITV
jgi:transposase